MVVIATFYCWATLRGLPILYLPIYNSVMFHYTISFLQYYAF